MKTQIIFDTDFGCDCDDAAALAVALELMNAGECDLLAVTSCTDCEAAAGCLESILCYYGHPEIPVGSFHEEDALGMPAGLWYDNYASKVAAQYDSVYKNGGHYENTVKVLRRALAQTQGKVKIVSTGALTSLGRLLTSGPDEISPLSGLELVRQKVECGVCMAGRFADQWSNRDKLWANYLAEGEFNVVCDIKAAQTVCELWPVDLIFCSFEIGFGMITCGGLQTKGSKDNPVRTCYEVWNDVCGKGVGRDTWDGATMFYGIRPDSGCWELHPFGKISVDDKGITSWQASAGGRQTYLLEKMAQKNVGEMIDDILNRDIVRHAQEG